MGLLSRAGRLLDSLRRWAAGKAASARTAPSGRGEPVLSGLAGFGYGAGSGLAPWQGSPVEQVLHFRHWVYRAGDAVARVVAKDPPRAAYRRTAGQRKSWEKAARYLRAKGRPVPHRAWLSRKALGLVPKAAVQLTAEDELEAVGQEHPLARLIARPNPFDHWSAGLWYEVVAFLEVTGSAYVWAVPNKNAANGGPVAELWALPSQWVRPVPNPAKGMLVEYYELTGAVAQGAAGGVVRFDPEEVIHFRYPSLWSKVYGCSPLQAFAEVVDVYDSMLLARFFSLKNGANLGTVIEIDPTANVDDAMLRRIEAEWAAKSQGEQNFNRPRFVQGGKVNRPDGPAELAFMQSMGLVRDDMLAFRGVPKNVAGIIDGVNRANNIAARDQFYHDTTNPIARVLSAVLTERLARRYGEDLVLYLEEQRVADPDQTRADFDVALRNGAATPNEYRAEVLHLPDFEHGGDDPIVPAGLAPLPIGTGEALDTDLDLEAAFGRIGRPDKPGTPAAARDDDLDPGEEGE